MTAAVAIIMDSEYSSMVHAVSLEQYQDYDHDTIERELAMAQIVKDGATAETP